MKFKALLFDLDGTLLDTAPDFIAALNTQLELHNRKPMPDSAIRSSVTNGSVGLIQAGFGLKPGDKQFDAIREEYLALYFNDIAVKTVLFEGVQRPRYLLRQEYSLGDSDQQTLEIHSTCT